MRRAHGPYPPSSLRDCIKVKGVSSEHTQPEQRPRPKLVCRSMLSVSVLTSAMLEQRIDAGDQVGGREWLRKEYGALMQCVGASLLIDA